MFVTSLLEFGLGLWLLVDLRVCGTGFVGFRFGGFGLVVGLLGDYNELVRGMWVGLMWFVFVALWVATWFVRRGLCCLLVAMVLFCVC